MRFSVFLSYNCSLGCLLSLVGDHCPLLRFYSGCLWKSNKEQGILTSDISTKLYYCLLWQYNHIILNKIHVVRCTSPSCWLGSSLWVAGEGNCDSIISFQKMRLRESHICLRSLKVVCQYGSSMSCSETLFPGSCGACRAGLSFLKDPSGLRHPAFCASEWTLLGSGVCLCEKSQASLLYPGTFLSSYAQMPCDHVSCVSSLSYSPL